MTEEPTGPPRGPWIPEHLRGLTHATDEQRAEIRAGVRRQLAELDAYWTPERRRESRQRLRERLLEHDPGLAERFAREDAEEADPPLRWRRLAEEAATRVAQAEQETGPDGVGMFREVFDRALAERRAGNAGPPAG